MLFIIQDPFPLSLMTVAILIAAVGVGKLESEGQGPGWMRNALVVYALPAFFIALLGFIYAANTYSLDDFFHCRDQICKTAAVADANHTFQIKLALIELAALTFIGTTAWFRRWLANRQDRYLPVPSNNSSGLFPSDMSNARGRPSHPNPDPNKWYFNEDTGEFQRITFRHGDRILVEQSTHNERESEELRKIRQHHLLVNALWISWIVTIALSACFVGSSAYNKPFFFFPLCCSGLFAVLFTIAIPFSKIGLFFEKKKVGPPPIKPRGRQDVDDQKAYGDAGFANLQDIHDALAGTKKKGRGKSGSHGILFEE